MALRIPPPDSAPVVSFEDAVQFVFDLPEDVPEFRSIRGRQIELHGTLVLIVLAAMVGLTRYREAGARQLDALLRRHWMIENRNHHIRDTHWREDTRTWRTGHTAFVMFAIVAIAMNLLRASSPRWTDRTPMTQRSIIAEHALTTTPATLLQTPS